MDSLVLTTMFPAESNTLATSVNGDFFCVPLEICAVTSSTACVVLTLVWDQATPGEP